MERRVLRPTKEHCQDVLDGLILHPISQYFNWFLIKYGRSESLVSIGEPYSLITAQCYLKWCKQFLENEND